MPNVVRGERMGGLLVYLAGPGRANEHTEPHLLAGDAAMMAWHDDNELDRSAALSVARHLDRPRVAFGVEMKGGHVWHCSLSLRAEEGQLTDEQWRTISTDFVDRMGFGDEEGSKAPCRWVAARHGLSTNGNDHVHLVVNLVREDGTKASIHNDRIRAQAVSRELEKAHGLAVLPSADRGRSSRGFDPAEREAAARRRAHAKFEQARRSGQERRNWASLPKVDRDARVAAEARADQPRWNLARQVRACAAASQDEAEFVRRMRRHGLLVRARFAEGRDDVVTGYSVAARPVAGERPIWYGGGHLAHDLTLPRLRAEWPDTPETAAAAAQEWAAAKRHRRPVAPGRETQTPDPDLWRQCGRELETLREQLRSVPVEDRQTWARVARQTAGAFAAWSYRVEAEPGPLAATADALARSAEQRTSTRPQQTLGASASGAALLLASAARGGQGATAQAIMLRQLANLAKALHDMHRAEGDARRAAAIAAAVRGQLATVAARLPDPGPVGLADTQAAEAAQLARRGQAPLRSPGSPIPADLNRPHAPAAGQGPRTRAPRPDVDERGR